MKSAGMTIKEATESWVHEMNAVPQGMIEKLMDDFYEVTFPSCGDRVYVFGTDCEDSYGEVRSIKDTENDDDDDVMYEIQLDKGERVTVGKDAFEVQYDSWLPMWGTMWSFGDSADDYWLDEMDGVRLMSQCGFRIYESDEFGYFFGIDGAGYDFYESHWLPLYKARGLHWHDPAAEAAEFMIEHGRKRTQSGNYHFEFEEIAKMFDVEVDDDFKESVQECISNRYSYMVSEFDVAEDFDFMFFTCFCPNYEEE